jgi:hypothetical protein
MSRISVYQVTVPEYKIRNFRKISELAYYNEHWKPLKVPKVYIDNQPDFKKIGSKIDNCLKKHFLNKEVAIRVLGSEEHNGKSINDLVKIIKQFGHDRYDSKRKGDRYENIENKKIDFFATDFKISKNNSYLEHFLEPFYYWPLYDRGKPIRIDIAIIYDLSKLKIVEHRYKGRENELKKDGFVFKYPNNKPDSILGIIKIL